MVSAFFAKSPASGLQREALAFSETPLCSKKASQDVQIALKVTNDVKDRSTVMAVGGFAIASTGVVAAVHESRISEARESNESTNARQNVAPSAVVLPVQGLAIVPAQVLIAEILCSILNFNRKKERTYMHMVGVSLCAYLSTTNSSINYSGSTVGSSCTKL